MCGIAGLSLNRASHSLPGILSRMVAAISHRGPDANGREIQIEGRNGLGHARLSIVDLSLGTQPLHDAASGMTISCNGELDNFREHRASLIQNGIEFRTNSETEVVLRAFLLWGESCLERFSGMFALEQAQ